MAKLFKVVQRFDSTRIDNIEHSVQKEMEKIREKVRPGSSVALAVGSRGIAEINLIVKAVVMWLRKKEVNPFIVPAMGSHGGATSDGQMEVLSSYGITESFVGAPIRSSMEVVKLPSANLPVKLYMDALAYESDGIIIINRIKQHPDYNGKFESGLVKMCVIGLGKHSQALEVHRYGVYGLKEIIPQCAVQILKSGKIIAGLAIVENAYNQPVIISALPFERIMIEEPELLQKARQQMPSLPVDTLDLLIVDLIGKDICGVGMDTSIIGRKYIRGEEEPLGPRIKAIVVRDITPNSHGNALGMGFADVITRRLFNKIDFASTNENVYTSTFLERAKIPIIAETDGQAVDYALRSCGLIKKGEEKIIRIKDTLHLSEIYVSEAVLNEIKDSPSIEATARQIPLVDSAGNCPDSF